MTHTLKAEIKVPGSDNKKIRENGQIPAVVYGKNQDPISLVFDYAEFLKLYRAVGESTIFSIDYGTDTLDVLIHDIQLHPRTDLFQHVDFYAITKGEKLSTYIEVEFINKSPCAESEQGVVQEYIKEVEVYCLPKDLVSHFTADLSQLKEFGDTITIADLNIDKEKFELSHEDSDIVAIVSEPRVEEVPDEAPELELPEGVAEENEDQNEEENSEEK